MPSAAPFSLRIFVAAGDPDGLQVVERTNWIGKAIVFPRSLYATVRSRAEFDQTGVYILIGLRDDGLGERLYIGEGDPVADRVAAHVKEKEFWSKALFFVAPGFLNKAHVQFLEARLIQLARRAKRAELENGNNPTEPSLSEADRADMEVFLNNMLGMLPVLGVSAFDLVFDKPVAEPNQDLTCSGRGATATGRDTAQGFVVLAGSDAVLKETDSLKKHFPNVSALRGVLLANGVLVEHGDKLKFTQDYTFNSPSLAAAVVMGINSSGRVDWKAADGRTLKEIQEATANLP